MNPKKTKLLFDRFKHLFKDRDDVKKSLMYFGFEHGDGWYNILENLFLEIEKHKLPEDFRIVQVKEKYGCLRVYFDPHLEDIDLLVAQAEGKSLLTCEECGDPGRLRTEGRSWIKTLCEECDKNDNKHQEG